MAVLVITLVVTNILWLLYFCWWRKKKTLGSIIITDEDSLYVELKDHESMDEIHKSKDVIFSVRHRHNIWNRVNNVDYYE